MTTWGPSITINPTVPPPNDSDMIGLLVATTNFHAQTPLVHVNLDIDVPNSIYKYRILSMDGRNWNQDYTLGGNPADPNFSTNTTGDKWLLHEVDLHRAIRTVIQRIIVRFSPDSLHVTF